MLSKTQAPPLHLITLCNEDVKLHVTNYGATITAIYTKDRYGNQGNIVAGFPNVSAYADNPHYFGCILGRNAGRIADAKFRLDGDLVPLSKNEGRHHLHGGFEGFDKKIWTVKAFIEQPDLAGVVLEYRSEDGEEGYPGNLLTTVTYTIDAENRLKIAYDAETDKPTPVSLSSHSYFNLTAFQEPTILNHQLQVFADAYTENNNEHVSTGKFVDLRGSNLDFSKLRTIGDDFPKDGLNHNYVLSDKSDPLAAILFEPNFGRIIKVYTDRPGLQVYTANDWSGNIIGPQERPYVQHGAIALETQSFPNAPNQPGFPGTILRPGEHFHSETIYEFSYDR